MKNRRQSWAVFSVATLIAISTSYIFFDLPVARFCHNLSQDTRNAFDWITKAGVATPWLVIPFLLFILFRWIRKNTRLANRALFFFSSVAVSGIVTDIIKPLAGRLRPKMLFENGLYGFDPFHIAHEFNSLPSGHATTVFAAATTCSIFWPKYRMLFYASAFIVAVSRLVLTAHYLSDVIAGAYIGICTAIVLQRLIPLQPSLPE